MTERSLFQDYLGPQWDALPPQVRYIHERHGTLRLEGSARVTRGSSVLSAMVAALFRFPSQSTAVEVAVTIQQKEREEVWVRDFGGRKFKSHLSMPPGQPGALFERFGPLKARLGLYVDDGSLFFPVTSAKLFGMPLPQWLLPRSEAREYVYGDVFHFDVAISLPLAGLIVRYQGWLKPHPQ